MPIQILYKSNMKQFNFFFLGGKIVPNFFNLKIERKNSDSEEKY